MITSGIYFKNFNSKLKKLKIKDKLYLILKNKNPILESLSKNYKNSFSNKILKKYKKYQNFRLIRWRFYSRNTNNLQFFKSQN